MSQYFTKKNLVGVLDFVALYALFLGLQQVWRLVGWQNFLIGFGVFWLVVGGWVMYMTFFSKRNMRGSLGCEKKPMNEFDEAAVQLFFCVPLFVPIFIWAAIKKKVGLDV